MRERLTALGATVLLCATVAQGYAQGAPTTLTRATMRNDFGVEVLGKALLYSFSYQRMVGTSFGLEAGFAAFGGGSASGSSTIAFFPLSAKVYLFPKNGSLYLTGGAVLITASTNSGPFSDNAAAFYGDVGLGFEARSRSGFVFRSTLYGLFGGGSYFIWPGVTIGYAF
ncbi:MAG TPA: hypothetical protein VGQ29_11955 [Gemmatimonadales bacterium]|jgi:hypothetical protein|nr:hypothetical protein [Gemmatimonadales bacterium]